jgi:xylose isomerase
MKRKLSMPFWCVGNPVGDPFGPAVLDRISSVEASDILCRAKKTGLIDYTSAHDDDLVIWDPEKPEDDLDPKSNASKTLREIKKRLDRSGLKMIMITCSLHGHPLFRNGGITNPDPEIRLLAAKKVMRAVRIGNLFGSKYFTYWVARDGFESQFAVKWDKCYQYLIEGLNLVSKYTRENGFSIEKGTIESKPNEPRSEMFLPTVGHAMAIIGRLKDPEFWGVNPELLQHEEMAGLSASAAAGFAASLNKLFFLHFGNQKPNQYDNDNPPLIGMDGLKESIGVFWVLRKLNWQGHVEFDCHPLRTDCAPGKKNALKIREDFIRMCVEAYDLVEKKVDELDQDQAINNSIKKIWAENCEISEMLAKGDTGSINSRKVNIKKLVETRIDIGRLDLNVNKNILSSR